MKNKMKKTEQRFNFWMPLEISKAKDKDGNMKMKIGGIASTSERDSDGEELDPSGFDVSYLLKKGHINWNHQTSKDPEAVIGEPTKASVTKKGLYIEGELYQDSPMAVKVYELAKMLEKSSSTRRMGFSIEGKATERDPMNPKKITKASVTGVALTLNPKNPNTLAQILKGETFEKDLFQDFTSDEETNGGKETIIADITREDGTRIIVDNKGKITYKAMEADGSGKNLKKEHVDGDTKDQLSSKKSLSKSEVIEKIMSDFSGINSSDAEKVFNIITKVSQNMKTEITKESIEKAYDVLGLNDVAPESTEIEKSKKIDSEKEEDEEDKISKDKEVEESDKEVKKAVETKEDTEKNKEGKEAKEEKEEPKAEEKKEEVKKAKSVNKESDEDDSDEEDMEKSKKKEDYMKKSFEDLLNKQTEMFKAVGTVLKEQKSQIENLQKSINERFENLESQPSTGRKSITKGASYTERFDTNDIEKSNDNRTFSTSRQKAKVLGILEQVTFEKGFDDEFGKAMTTFESSGYLNPVVIKRLQVEKGITLVG